MARKINRLNARMVATLTKTGRHADGGGLYLSISPNGGRRWVFLFRWHGRPIEIGFGSARDVQLGRARELATQARAMLAEGSNPKDARKSTTIATLGSCADQVIDAMRPSWRNAKHGAQWEMTLREYAAPLRRLRVDQINTDDILSVLSHFGVRRQKRLRRLRGRIERVLDAAKARGMRSGENPARWRGHLNQLLPKPRKLTRGHHAAMPYDDLPSFICALQMRDGTASRALEFAILTAARTNEVLGAHWNEFDLERKAWTVPAERNESTPRSPSATLKESTVYLGIVERGSCERVRVPRSKKGPGVVPDVTRNDTSSNEGRECYGSWLPIDVSRLVGGVHQFPQRGVRSSAHSRYQ